MERSEPTISKILFDLAHEYDGIVAEREILDRVLERRPSQAKDPYASIRNKLRYEATEVGWVRLGNGELMPWRTVLQELRFRVIPTETEITSALLARAWLVPFIALNQTDLHLEDAVGQPIQSLTTNLPRSEGIVSTFSAEAQTLSDWFKRTHFAPGDSILITVRQAEPTILRLEREAVVDFRASDVAEQEYELLEALTAQVARNRADMLYADDAVLPVYARASWRTSYPGRPWQSLVAADHRLRLIDGMYLADSNFRRPLDRLFGNDQHAQLLEQQDRELLKEIADFQTELLSSRRDAAMRGIWNGVAPRASTGRIIFDTREGTSQLIHPGTVDALVDHSNVINERIERGDYDNEEWDDTFNTHSIDEDEIEIDVDFEDPELYNVDTIEDLQAFAEQNPQLIEATQRLMASLTPNEIAQLNAAQTPDQVQRVLIKHLNALLVREPALFVELTPQLPAPSGENGNVDSLYPTDLLLAEEEQAWLNETNTNEWEDDDDEDDEDDEEIEINEMLERSNQWMERFYQSLLLQGKSDTTAASRASDLWIYADFLSSYYNRSLEEGDYATLDECLFFFYPRKVINHSPRAAREICTSIKQFYAFLRANEVIRDDSFAQAIWRRRDQAARAIELYERIDGESPRFERLFAHLFAPYTA